MSPLLEALESTTSPERLRELACHEDAPVRRAVTQNPSTPPELLFALGEVFPKELAKNPALFALSRGAPELIRRIPATTARMLLTVGELPEQLWALLASHEDVLLQMEVLSSPKAPPNVLTVTARAPSPYACASVAGNPSAPLALLGELSRHKDYSVRARVAENPSAPPDVLEALARDEDELVRRGVAGNPHAPRSALERLALDTSYRVCLPLANNPSIPEATLEQLSRDEFVYLRCAIASNPSTPARLFPELLRRDSVHVSKAVAQNPNTPVELLRRLADSQHDEVLEALTANPSAPRDILEAIQKRQPGRAAAPRDDRPRFTMPSGAQPIYTGQNFRVYRIDHEGEPRCLKIPVAATNLGIFEAQRVVGGVSTAWNLQCSLGSPPHRVGWTSPEALLESEFQRLKEARGTWNHEPIALVGCELGGETVPALITQWHEGELLGALPRAEQRALFPRMLPSFWDALAAARHGDLHPDNILLSPGRERFHVIDPGAMVARDLGEVGACGSIKNLSFVTNAEHYPLLPPYYTPDFSLKRGDSLRGHWDRYKWSFSLSRMAPAVPSIYPNVMMRSVDPSRGDFIEDHTRPADEPCPADLLALGVMYYRMLTGASPFPALAQPAWSQVSTVDDQIMGNADAERELERGIAPPSALVADVTRDEERLALALLDLQVVSRDHLQSLAYRAASSLSA